MATPLEIAILRTVIYFDQLEYPLTQFEVWKYLFSPNSGRVSLGDVVRTMRDSFFLKEHTEWNNGFIFLQGRRALVLGRLDRAILADHKYRSIRFISALLAHIPFVRMVCACNTLALGTPKKESDIDLFIVARKGHLWFVRLLCVIAVVVFSHRPSRANEEDGICLSFYAADVALDLSVISLPNQETVPDVYLLYWICWCVPLYDDGVYEDFYRANTWIEAYVPHRIRYIPIPLRRISMFPPAVVMKNFFELLYRVTGSFFERCSRTVQERFVSRKLINESKKGGTIIMNDSFLKLHINDRRQELRAQFIASCERRGVGFTL